MPLRLSSSADIFDIKDFFFERKMLVQINVFCLDLVLPLEDMPNESIPTVNLPENCLVDWDLLENFEEQPSQQAVEILGGLSVYSSWIFRLGVHQS